VSSRDDKAKDSEPAGEGRPPSRSRREPEGGRDRRPAVGDSPMKPPGGRRDRERPVSRPRSRDRDRPPSRDRRVLERPGDMRRSDHLDVLHSSARGGVRYGSGPEQRITKKRTQNLFPLGAGEGTGSLAMWLDKGV
jgi:hypothetical protein